MQQGNNIKEYLATPAAFKAKYSKNPIISKAIISGILGIGAASTAVGAAASAGASTAASAGFAGFVAHFASWPLIGSAATSYVAGVAGTAATAAAIGALPISITAGTGIGTTIWLLIRKKRRPYQKGSGLNSLAGVVSEIIFLPMLSKYKGYVENTPQWQNAAINDAVSRIQEWGYNDFIAKAIVEEAFQLSSEELNKRFDEIIQTLNKLKKKEEYKGIPKYELPPVAITKISTELANSVIVN